MVRPEGDYVGSYRPGNRQIIGNYFPVVLSNSEVASEEDSWANWLALLAGEGR